MLPVARFFGMRNRVQSGAPFLAPFFDELLQLSDVLEFFMLELAPQLRLLELAAGVADELVVAPEGLEPEVELLGQFVCVLRARLLRAWPRRGRVLALAHTDSLDSTSPG